MNSIQSPDIFAMHTAQKQTYQPEIEAIKRRHSQRGQQLIQRAYDYSVAAHHGQLRLSGEPYVTHCIQVARILEDLEMDFVSITAGLLHDVLEDTATTMEQLTQAFPDPVPLLVEGVTKISELSLSSARERYVENLRKMLIAMVKDIRVIIIKLSDRLHNMRTLQYLPENKRLNIAKDTLDIYAPLANRLGITRIRCEIEDLAMKFLYTSDYNKIVRYVEKHQSERDEFIQNTISFLQSYLERYGTKPIITGRAKNIYSIYQKMKRQHIDLDDIYDLMALRVIVESEEQCWAVLGRIHSLWRPMPDRFKDYISMPKENMYRSIHTTVVGPGGQRIEIQIRTSDMHHIAEKGIAAHWKYKEGVKGKTDFEEKFRWLRQLTEWIRDVKDPGDFMKALKEEIFSDTIFCFTPKGDVLDLPRGATPLDFAYRIHTEVGNKCQGAKVNNKMVSIRDELHNGDIVNILTAKDAHPSPDWLEIVRTPTARSKIRRYLRSQIYHEKVKKGEEILVRELRQKNLEYNPDGLEEKLASRLHKLNVRDIEQLFAEIGFGTVSVSSVVNTLVPEPKSSIPTRARKPVKEQLTHGIVLKNMGTDRDFRVRLARCCSPLPGDKIIGFTTLNRGIAIHRKDCSNLKRILAEVQPDHSRIIPAEWKDGRHALQHISLRITAWDRKGLLKEITTIISEMNIDILATSTKSFKHKQRAVLNLQLSFETREQYNKLIANLKSISGLISIKRSSKQWA